MKSLCELWSDILGLRRGLLSQRVDHSEKVIASFDQKTLRVDLNFDVEVVSDSLAVMQGRLEGSRSLTLLSRTGTMEEIVFELYQRHIIRHVCARARAEAGLTHTLETVHKCNK